MRKQILIFGHNDAPQFIDIYNQYTRLFDPVQFEVTVVYLMHTSLEETRAKTLAENCIFLSLTRKQLRYLKFSAIRKMYALVREKNFAIAICHRYKPTYVMLWVRKLCRIPTLVSVMHELGTMRSIKRQVTIAALAPKEMWFAGVSNAVRNDLRRNLWCVANKRIITLYNMIDVELTEPQFYSREQARMKLGLAQDDFVFGNLGRLVKNKDHATLIKAFALIKPHCPNAKLIVMGTGELETTLKQQIQDDDLTQDIILTGFVNSGFRYMKAFDCFVLSSIQEAYGRVLLEAMIAKVPIIASRVHGIPEVMGELGCLVEPRDVEDFASAMRNVLALSLVARQQRGAQGYAHAVQHFSIPVFQRHFSELLELNCVMPA